MEDLVPLLLRHGPLLVFVVTLAARAGAPVPAAPLRVVAGGLPWKESSRGPAGEYGSAPGTGPPHLAHRIEHPLVNDKGTSFASPRACADAADLVLDPRRRPGLLTAADVAQGLLGLSSASPWNSRTGFGGVLN